MKNLNRSAAIILGTLFGASLVFGYIPTGNYWRSADMPVQYWLNPSGAPAGTDAALVAAMQTWQAECRSNWDFVYMGTTTQTGAANDAKNICFFTAYDDLSTIATTSWWYDLGDGHTLDADVAFNTNFTWSTAAVCPPGDMDVQDIATHEFGHFLGLGDLYKPVNAPKTMYGYSGNGETQKRTIEQDDRDGVAYVYPNDPNERVWIKDSTDDYGCTPYTGPVFWASPDIRLKDDPPMIDYPDSIYVTARNMMPTAQTARINVQVERYVGVEPLWGPPYLWTSGDVTVTIPAAWDTLLEGKKEFGFGWIPAYGPFHEGHYCIDAAVQTFGESGDLVRNGWAPMDNDVGQRNVEIVSGLSGGAPSSFTFNAGNPTGDSVIMTLHLNRGNLPKDWWVGLDSLPEDQPILLGPSDTLRPVRFLVTPRQGAGNGEYYPVDIVSKLTKPGTGEQIGGGGITARPIVGKPHDVAVVELLLPPDEVDVGTMVTPKATFKNLGSYDETFPAICAIGSDYADTINVNLTSGGSTTDAFKDWQATCSSPVTVTAVYPMDAFPENNVLNGTILVKGSADSTQPRGIAETKNRFFELSASRPNPFAKTTSITYTVPYATPVSLKVYDATGKLISTLVDRYENPGTWSLTWDGTDNTRAKVGSGIYFIRLETPTSQTLQKIVRIR